MAKWSNLPCLNIWQDFVVDGSPHIYQRCVCCEKVKFKEKNN